MGFVYSVEHIRLHQQLALKVLNPATAGDADLRQGFELEASVFGRIQNEHVVRPLDVGFDGETGCHYLTMELLRGSTFESLIHKTGPLPPKVACALLRQVAAGLDAAHGYRDAQGKLTPIVHRDLKPQNLFACQLDREPLVKILDFGIAKLLSDSTGLSLDLKGTYAYMSPEQAAAERISPQTDIWALGLIAYYLLTAARYWRGSVPRELLTEIVRRPLPAIERRLREQGLVSHLPPSFETWLWRCLERQPGQRFPSAGVAVDELERAFAETERDPNSVAVESAQKSASNGPALSRTEPAVTEERVCEASASASGGSVPAILEGTARPTARGARARLAVALLVSIASAAGYAWRRELAPAGRSRAAPFEARSTEVGTGPSPSTPGSRGSPSALVGVDPPALSPGPPVLPAEPAPPLTGPPSRPSRSTASREAPQREPSRRPTGGTGAATPIAAEAPHPPAQAPAAAEPAPPTGDTPRPVLAPPRLEIGDRYGKPP